MKLITQINRYAVWLFFFTGCVMLFPPSFVVAQNSSTEMTVDGALFSTQGSVRRVSLEEHTITLKISKNERIRFQVTPATAFIGIKLLDELKKGQRLKVWYNLVGEESRAVKIEVLLETGC